MINIAIISLLSTSFRDYVLGQYLHITFLMQIPSIKLNATLRYYAWLSTFICFWFLPEIKDLTFFSVFLANSSKVGQCGKCIPQFSPVRLFTFCHSVPPWTRMNYSTISLSFLHIMMSPRVEKYNGSNQDLIYCLSLSCMLCFCTEAVNQCKQRALISYYVYKTKEEIVRDNQLKVRYLLLSP